MCQISADCGLPQLDNAALTAAALDLATTPATLDGAMMSGA
jgi:hypothetical protein